MNAVKRALRGLVVLRTRCLGRPRDQDVGRRRAELRGVAVTSHTAKTGNDRSDGTRLVFALTILAVCTAVIAFLPLKEHF